MNSETLSLKTIINKFYLLKEKEKSYDSMKRLKKKKIFCCLQPNKQKKADPSDAKDYYNSYLKKKNTKLVK